MFPYPFSSCCFLPIKEALKRTFQHRLMLTEQTNCWITFSNPGKWSPLNTYTQMPIFNTAEVMITPSPRCGRPKVQQQVWFFNTSDRFKVFDCVLHKDYKGRNDKSVHSPPWEDTSVRGQMVLSVLP